jgi:hypothetical protein
MKQPVNRLVMMRAKGFFGPLFQKTAPGRFVKSAGGAGTTEPNYGEGAALLLETEDFLLLESGDKLLLENAE